MCTAITFPRPQPAPPMEAPQRKDWWWDGKRGHVIHHYHSGMENGSQYAEWKSHGLWRQKQTKSHSYFLATWTSPNVTVFANVTLRLRKMGGNYLITWFPLERIISKYLEGDSIIPAHKLVSKPDPEPPSRTASQTHDLRSFRRWCTFAWGC